MKAKENEQYRKEIQKKSVRNKEQLREARSVSKEAILDWATNRIVHLSSFFFSLSNPLRVGNMV
jgi:hypothetical protein